MSPYAEAQEVIGRMERHLNRAGALLERVKGLTEDEGFDISPYIGGLVQTETLREELFARRGLPKKGDAAWNGDSMDTYSERTTVDGYIDVAIGRIGSWLSV